VGIGTPNNSGWTCPRCEGAGFVLDDHDEAIPCTCHGIRVQRARSHGVSSVIPRRYRGVSFERNPVPALEQVNPVVVREVRRYVQDVDRRLSAGKGLWLTGDVGTGKTTLAMLISKAAIDNGRTVAVYSVPHLLAEIRDTYSAEGREDSYMDFFRRLSRVELLHLEDLGAEKQTDWVLEQLYSLINQRYEDERAIVATTNLDYGQLEQQIGARTASRLAEICGDLWPLFGPDQRLENQQYEETRSALG
jgi:DNA replication protein DnaC